MSTKHTEGTAVATEWSSHAPTTIKAGDVVIAECGGHGNDTDLDIVNAKRLALAWNCHDELVEALGGLLTQLNRFLLADASDQCQQHCDHDTVAAERSARAVLAKVKGGE